MAIPLLAGCWPFEPRPAERPATNVATLRKAWTPEEAPGIVQSVYNNPFPALELNKILAADFRFHSDPAEATGSRMWNLDEEITITAAIMSHFPSMVLQFGPPESPDPISQSPVWISRPYQLSLVDSQGVSFNYAGEAEFLVVEQSTQEWMIREWYDYDIKTDSLPSIGQLKIQYRR